MLTRTERAIWWREDDSPHAGHEDSTPTLAPMRAGIPRGSAGMQCCGVAWEDRADADAHRSSVHH